MLPPRLWGENTEPQNITCIRQNKAPMCTRCNNLQCLPCHPKLLEHAVFQSCAPTCLVQGQAQLLLAEVLALLSACLAFCLHPRSWALCLGWSPGGWGGGFMHYVASQKCFGVCWLSPVELGRFITASKQVRHMRLPSTWLVPSAIA